MANRIETGLKIKGLSGDTNTLHVIGNSFINGDINITGNVNVIGTATTLNTETVQTRDNRILLNYSGTTLSAIGGGIEVLSGKTNGTNISLTTDSNGDWNSNTGLNISGKTSINLGSTSGTDIAIQASGGIPFLSANRTFFSVNNNGRLTAGIDNTISSSLGHTFAAPIGSSNAFTVASQGLYQGLFSVNTDGSFSIGNTVIAGNYFVSNGTNQYYFIGSNGGQSQNIGINTVTPTSSLHIKGSDSSSSNYGLKVQNSGGTNNFVVRNDGYVTLGTSNSQSYVGLSTTKDKVFQLQYSANTSHYFELWTDSTTSNSYIGCRSDLEFWNTSNGKFLYYDSTIYSLNTKDTILFVESSIKGQGTNNGVINGNNTSTQVGTQIGIYGSSKGVSATNTNIGGKFTATGALYNYGLIVEEGNVGINTSTPTAKLDISGNTGYNQLRLRTSYTPTSSSDTNGNVGDMAWDDNYFYWKTSSQWLRVSGQTF